jgi:hypothetical protein
MATWSTKDRFPDLTEVDALRRHLRQKYLYKKWANVARIPQAMSSSTVLTPARTSSEDSIQAAKRTVQPFNRRSGSSRSDLDSSVSSVSDPREEEPQKFKRLSTKSGLVVYDRNIEDSGKRHLPSLLPLATAAPARRFLDEATMQSPVSASPTSPKKPTQHHSHADTKLNSWQYFDDDDDAFFKLMQSRAKEIVPAVDTNPFKKEPTFVRERVEMERSFSELQRRSVALVEPERPRSIGPATTISSNNPFLPLVSRSQPAPQPAPPQPTSFAARPRATSWMAPPSYSMQPLVPTTTSAMNAHFMPPAPPTANLYHQRALEWSSPDALALSRTSQRSESVPHLSNRNPAWH